MHHKVAQIVSLTNRYIDVCNYIVPAICIKRYSLVVEGFWLNKRCWVFYVKTHTHTNKTTWQFEIEVGYFTNSFQHLPTWQNHSNGSKNFFSKFFIIWAEASIWEILTSNMQRCEFVKHFRNKFRVWNWLFLINMQRHEFVRIWCTNLVLEIGISWWMCRAIVRIWDINLVLEIDTCETRTIKGAYGFGETTNSSKD